MHFTTGSELGKLQFSQRMRLSDKVFWRDALFTNHVRTNEKTVYGVIRKTRKILL